MKTCTTLLNATVEGYRNINKASLDFGELTTLVSTNSYGKSNLMNAIDFAVDFIHAAQPMKRAMMSYYFCVPLNTGTAGKNFRAGFQFAMNLSGARYIVGYGFSFEWVRDGGGGCRIVDEWLTAKEDKKNQKANTLIRRGENALYKASPEGRCTTPIRVKDDELIINRLMLEENLYYHELVEQVNFVQVYVERHFDTVGLFSQGNISRFEDALELKSIYSIPETVFQLKQQHPDRYELLMDAFLQLFPNIQSIDVREIDLVKQHSLEVPEKLPFTLKDKVYSMYVQDVNLNQPININSMSDGARRVFLMLTITVIAELEGISLIAIEEPENSVHPGLLQSYLSVLAQLAGNCRILIASHSPYIVQYVNTEDIYIGKPNSDGLADFARVKSAKVNALLRDSINEGMSVGDYIFDLLSGGEDDAAVLCGYLEG